MRVPRRLGHTNVNYINQPHIGHVVEADDVTANVLIAPAGYEMTDDEAQRLGITEYLAQHPQPPGEPEAKAVEQSSVEDKAVTPEESKAEEPKAEEPPEPPAAPPPRGRRP